MRQILLLTTLLTLTAPPSLAQGGGEQRGALVKAYDTDGDGRLSAAERRVLFEHLRKQKAGEPIVDARPTRLPAPERLYKAAAGKLGTRTATATLPRAGKLSRDLPVRATWPDADGGPWPLLVWSHGAFGSRDTYRPLVEHLVSHGYVVIQSTHPDSTQAGGRFGDRSIFKTAWQPRVREVSAVIDRLDELGRLIPALAGRVNKDAIAVGGHSFGAGTSQLIAGARTNSERASHRDERVKAALLVSPQGRGDILPDEQSWRGVAVPIMVITGTQDTGRNGQAYTWRLEPFRFAPARPVKYLLVIADGTHSFGDITGSFPLNGLAGLDGDHRRQTVSGALAFLDRWLKRDAAAARYLASDGLSAASGGKTVYQREGRDPLARDDQKSALDKALGE